MSHEHTADDERSESDEESLVLPRRSVDPDAGLEDRLTGNIRNRAGPSRYFSKDSEGNLLETGWDEVFERVAKNLAVAEAVHHDTRIDVAPEETADWVDFDDVSWKTPAEYPHRPLDEDLAPYVEYDSLIERVPDQVARDMHAFKADVEQLMREQRFMFNSPTLMNAGDELQQLSACFVSDPKDDLEDIFETTTQWAMVQKTGGGMGGAFHLLRPKGDPVSSTGGVSSGPVSFMTVFNDIAGTIKQGGVRRGAQMAIMHSQHPDVGRFAVAKRGDDELTNFNISVGFSDEFVEAIENDETYELKFPIDSEEPYEVTPEVAHFYDPRFEDAWNADFDKPAEGLDGKVVEENFWRDYVEDMQDPEAFEAYRDQIELEPGEPLELPARFIFQMIIDGAHNNGEPGLFAYDECNREHSFDVEAHPENRIESTNPCVTGDTLVHTDDGLVPIRELSERGEELDVTVDSRLADEQTKEAVSAYRTGEKPVCTLETEEGYQLRLTADHRVKTTGGWVPAGELSPGDDVFILDREGAFGTEGSPELGRVLGWLVGDGHLKDGEERAVLNFYDEKATLSEQLAEDTNEVIRDAEYDRTDTVGVNTVDRDDEYRGPDAIEQRVKSDRLYELADEHGLTNEKRQVPDAILRGSRETARNFLSALFSADGSVQGTLEKGYSIRLATTSLDLAHDVQRLLANFGILSKIYEDRREAGQYDLPDGKGDTREYDCQAVHEVAITSSSMVEFAERIGFILDEKSDLLDEVLDSCSRGPYSTPAMATVESVTEESVEPVYDLTEPDTNSFVANGVVVHNCSEQPLVNYESCTLGHVNLSLVAREDGPVWDDFETDASDEHSAFVEAALDTDELERVTRLGTHALDNVLAMNNFPLEEIAEQAQNKRKIGLGIMGLHQLLIQLGVEYGSEDGVAITREIMRRIDQAATRASHDLATERGAFPEWDDSKWANLDEHPEWARTHAHFDPDDVTVFDDDGQVAYPVRNHNQTTVAPTGTTSMVADTSAGCEPIYEVAFYKNVGDDIQGEDFLVEFDDYFLDVLEANDIDSEAVEEEAKQLMSTNDFEGIESLDRVPDELDDLFVTAGELDVGAHIRMQAACQDYVDSGISKTLNVSNDATIEEVGEAYLQALDLGIKGTTVYRDGSRDEQVKTTRATDNKLDGEADLSEVPTDTLLEELAERDGGVDVQAPSAETDTAVGED